MGVISAAAKALIAAGVTGDALVTALEQIEDAARPIRSAEAERAARYRARKRDDVTTVVTSVTRPPPPPIAKEFILPPHSESADALSAPLPPARGMSGLNFSRTGCGPWWGSPASPSRLSADFSASGFARPATTAWPSIA